MHVGGNDVHVGKRPEQVLADIKSFVTKVRARFPTIPVAFASTSPDPSRCVEATQRKAANRVMRDYIAKLLFIDLSEAMPTPNGKTRG